MPCAMPAHLTRLMRVSCIRPSAADMARIGHHRLSFTILGHIILPLPTMPLWRAPDAIHVVSSSLQHDDRSSNYQLFGLRVWCGFSP